MRFLMVTLTLIGAHLCVNDTSASPREPLRFEPLGDESYAETLTLLALLDDRSYLLVQTMLTNGGVGDEKPACRVLFVPAKGKIAHQVERGGDWSYNKSRAQLKLGSCQLTQEASGLTWHAKTEEITAKISFKGKPKLSALPKVKGDDDDEFFSSNIVYPWAQFKVQIKAPKLGRVNQNGVGILNHTRSTMLPPDVAKRWLKIYAFQPAQGEEQAGTPLLIALRKPPENGQAQGWTWSQGSKRPRKLSARELKVFTPWLMSDVPKTSSFSIGKESKIQIRKIKTLFTYEPVRQYGMMGRLAKSWIGDPINRMSLIEVTRDGKKLLGLTEEIVIR
jgi:hypothetical protein